jgi:multicomponent Na+:H+ antiporter subunit E
MGKTYILSYMVVRHYQASASKRAFNNPVKLPVVLSSELCALALRAGEDSEGRAWQTAVARAMWFAILWFALAGFHFADLPAAVMAVVAATWASLRLLPPGSLRPSITALVALALRFAKQSIIAGVDVAWRALDPRMRLRPGLVTCDARLPPGPARNAFLTLMSLLPGSLPAWQGDNGKITVHCLDVSQSVAAQMAEEEKVLIRALGVDPNND